MRNLSVLLSVLAAASSIQAYASTDEFDGLASGSSLEDMDSAHLLREDHSDIFEEEDPNRSQVDYSEFSFNTKTTAELSEVDPLLASETAWLRRKSHIDPNQMLELIPVDLAIVAATGSVSSRQSFRLGASVTVILPDREADEDDSVAFSPKHRDTNSLSNSALKEESYRSDRSMHAIALHRDSLEGYAFQEEQLDREHIAEQDAFVADEVTEKDREVAVLAKKKRPSTALILRAGFNNSLTLEDAYNARMLDEMGPGKDITE